MRVFQAHAARVLTRRFLANSLCLARAGLFLVFISCYVFVEAIERVFEPPEISQPAQLFVVSLPPSRSPP